MGSEHDANPPDQRARMKALPERAVWTDGWLAGTHRCESPNFGPRPNDVSIDLVVIHSISLPPGEYGGDEIEQLFTNTLDWDAHPYFQQIRDMEVSAHFLVRRDGRVIQFVSCNSRAWHAGKSSWRGRDDCNDFSVGIELEGLEGGLFETKQYLALAPLIEAVTSHYPVTAVVGHEHIAPGRKSDPGEGFDWARLKSSLGSHASGFTIGFA